MDGVLGVEEANFKMGSPLDIEPTFLESGPWNQEGRSALDEELAMLEHHYVEGSGQASSSG